MSTVEEQIIEHKNFGTEFNKLTEEQLNELTAKWLIEDCPGEACDAKDFFNDALVSNGELMAPLLLKMAGKENPNFNIIDILMWGIREECQGPLEEYWNSVTEQFNHEAA